MIQRFICIGAILSFWVLPVPNFRLTWNETNLWNNGGFEQRLDGWVLPASGKLLTGANGIAEGTNAIRVIFGDIARDLNVPNVAGPITLSFASANNAPEGLSIQLRDSDNRLLKTAPFWSDGHDVSWLHFSLLRSDAFCRSKRKVHPQCDVV